jgi:hypothetical protein
VPGCLRRAAPRPRAARAVVAIAILRFRMGVS